MTVLQLIPVHVLSRPEVCMEQQPVKLLMSALSLATQLEGKAQVGASAMSLLVPNIDSCSKSRTGESQH
jgi:hypothetical protein